MIVAIDGKQVASVDALREAIAAHKPGDKVSLTVVHADGTKATIERRAREGAGRRPTS